ncbi:hypothetical protein LIT25_13775 [Bacillus sp. F19]|nr:hypothetical protein LIT25_13775 [Bacillus sp. F19]
MDLILYLIFILLYFILFGFGFFLITRKATVPGIILVLITLGIRSFNWSSSILEKNEKTDYADWQCRIFTNTKLRCC